MITFEQAEKAWEYLRDTCDEAAEKEANFGYVTEYRKSKKAEVMARFAHLPVNAQEREAYADQEYKEFLSVIEKAEFEYRKTQFLREAARIKISLFQTISKAGI